MSNLGTLLVAQIVNNPSAMQETWVRSWVGKIHGRRERLPTPVFLPGESHRQRSLVGYSPWGHKESDMTERLNSHTGGSAVQNLPTNAGDASLIPESGRSPEEEMATHASILAWEIPWTEEPAGLQSRGLQRVRHDSARKQQQMVTHRNIYTCVSIQGVV